MEADTTWVNVILQWRQQRQQRMAFCDVVMQQQTVLIVINRGNTCSYKYILEQKSRRNMIISNIYIYITTHIIIMIAILLNIHFEFLISFLFIILFTHSIPSYIHTLHTLANIYIYIYIDRSHWYCCCCH